MSTWHQSALPRDAAPVHPANLFPFHSHGTLQSGHAFAFWCVPMTCPVQHSGSNTFGREALSVFRTSLAASLAIR